MIPVDDETRSENKLQQNLVILIVCMLQPLVDVQHEKLRKLFRKFHLSVIIRIRRSNRRLVLHQHNIMCTKFIDLFSLFSEVILRQRTLSPRPFIRAMEK